MNRIADRLDRRYSLQTKNVMALLASPYPLNGSVVVINQTAQLINETGHPVPLSEVCEGNRMPIGLTVAC